MVKIDLMKKNEVQVVAKFISDLNKIEQSHIGYCGKDSLEIAHSLINDITDITYDKSFVTVYEKEELIGVLGFDADLENNSAEIWGPFVKGNKWDIVNSMCEKMYKLLPEEINTICMFPNSKNSKVLQLATNLSFIKHSDQTILQFSRDRKDELEDVPILELREEYFIEMVKLHEETFPGTYYTGQQIIDRLNENRKVFIIVNNNQVSGYVYVESEPAYGEASIEFFAVKESERGKGIGCQLLTVALKWLFTIDSIQSITLCVNSSNQKAINLYKRVGFKHIHDLCFFTKKM
ncbi:MAG: GNAT family N-acetyltransferase [Anaerobacillus sp.]|uniref:GNAT family N-acetyltransferase n=1 Tax=Anaerobacillus sp. TaxID=1872506 RepID=UPI00391A542B